MLNYYIRKMIGNVRKHLLDGYSKKSYSQEGEDMILKRLFGNRRSGFYIDVGAHHPKRYSNTYYFYKRGWNGINIDAMPGSMEPFMKQRPRDINIESAISDKSETLDFYIFNEPALNSFTNKTPRNSGFKLIETKKIQTKQLKDVLAKNIVAGKEIDFMTIDVEGLDYGVLRSNDWKRFSPKVILVELIDSSLDRMKDDKIYEYLSSKDYRLFAKTCNTFFFINKQLNPESFK